MDPASTIATLSSVVMSTGPESLLIVNEMLGWLPGVKFITPVIASVRFGFAELSYGIT